MEYDELPQPGAPNIRGKRPLPAEKQLLIFLWYLGNNETFRSISNRFGVSRSTVHLCLSRILNIVIEKLVPRYIVWPRGEDVQSTVEGFSHISHLPSVLGAVDGMHVHIKAPLSHSDSYTNRKKFHSIIL